MQLAKLQREAGPGVMQPQKSPSSVGSDMPGQYSQHQRSLVSLWKFLLSVHTVTPRTSVAQKQESDFPPEGTDASAIPQLSSLGIGLAEQPAVPIIRIVKSTV